MHELRGDLGAANGSPHGWAARALSAYATQLGVTADDYRWEQVRHTPVGVTVRGRQYRGGLPVAGTDALVVARHGRVRQVDAHGSSLPGTASASPVGGLVARTAALARLDVVSLLVPASVTRVLAPLEGHLVDTYQVSLVSLVPAKVARVDIDAATGAVLRIVDDAAYDDAHAGRGTDTSARAGGTSIKVKIYDPNPIVTSRNNKLRSPFETSTGVDIPLDSAALTKQLKVRTAKGLDATKLSLGILSGPYANIVAPVGFIDPLAGPLSYSRSDPRFVGIMAYTHVDRYQRWLQSLGITDVNQAPQDLVPTLAQGFDNSFYQGGNDVIVYGGGGVPDAEDAEVILHEYGHAMQDAQVPGYGANEQGGSMGEGFGDFNAANYFALTSGGFQDLCAADWDATSYSSTNPPCLRRLDSTKKFPEDKQGEVHADGEIWSAYLWRLRQHLGDTVQQRSVRSIRLVLAMHELLTPNAKYGNAIAGLRTAAKSLGHPQWATFVDREAKKSGYPLNP